MSQRLISRNSPLKRLRDEGYDVAITGGYLVVRHVPYVTPRREVAYGVLACAIEISGERVCDPVDHTVRFAGDQPCTSDGVRYEKIINQQISEVIGPGVVATYSFSSKPLDGRYVDYHEKMSTYATILETEARAIDSTVTARGHRPVVDDGSDGSVFRYIDTASSRAGINAISDRLSHHRVAIVGVGGTGSYILDFVAKTHVEQIHLFDADVLLQHNVFRMPGALSEEELRKARTKVSALHEIYSNLRTGVVPHEYRIDEHNVHELADMHFVFLSLTDGEAKKVIVDALEEYGVPFVDCGMGLYEVEGTLAGQVRVTTSTPAHRSHVHDRHRIPFIDGEQDAYSRNIQIAELNALNATLAVIRWKKHSGLYLDLDSEHHTVYVLDGNQVINEDKDQDADQDRP